MISPNEEKIPVCYAKGIEPHMYQFLDPTTMDDLDYEPIKASRPLPWTNSVLPTLAEVNVLCKVESMDALPEDVVSLTMLESLRLGRLDSPHFNRYYKFHGFRRMGWRERRRMEKEWKSFPEDDPETRELHQSTPNTLEDASNFPVVHFSHNLSLLAELPDSMDFFREVRDLNR